MFLYPGETPVCSEQMYAWMPPQQVPGTLYLTNHRLVFEGVTLFHQEYGLEQALGLAPQSAPPMLNLEIRLITNVSSTPGATGWHTLRVEASGGAYVYNFQTPRAPEWVNSIQQIRGQSPLPSAGPPGMAPNAPYAALPPAAAATPRAPPMTAAPPISTGSAPGTVWCMRCGKSNASGASQCSSCGSSLG